MGLKFPYAKSLYAVLECLLATTLDRPDALILDFFAGSGTTLHATSLLNAMHGGKRRSILVTNNEVDEETARELCARGVEPDSSTWEKHGIAESITWPRCERAISGRLNARTPIAGRYKSGLSMSEGFLENAAYFKLHFLDPAKVSRGDSFEGILPILWMLAGCIGPCKTSRGSKPWFIPEKNPFAVLLEDREFESFKKHLVQHQDVPITHIFLVTDSAESFAEMAAELGPAYRCIQLYKSYLDTFKINLAEPNGLRETGRAI
jgi:adenine-specific DNA-methyltransferase